MDRRQQKTREAVFLAFSTLLETKRYETLLYRRLLMRPTLGEAPFTLILRQRTLC